MTLLSSGLERPFLPQPRTRHRRFSSPFPSRVLPTQIKVVLQTSDLYAEDNDSEGATFRATFQLYDAQFRTAIDTTNLRVQPFIYQGAAVSVGGYPKWIWVGGWVREKE